MAAQWDTQLAILDLKPVQVKVLKSLQRNWTALTVFLGDLDIPIHNNVALSTGIYNPQDLAECPCYQRRFCMNPEDYVFYLRPHSLAIPSSEPTQSGFSSLVWGASTESIASRIITKEGFA